MSEEVQVNGEICTQRGKIKNRDLVEYKGQKFAVK